MFRWIVRGALFGAGFILLEQFWSFGSVGPLALTPNKIIVFLLAGLAVVKAVIEPAPLPRNTKNLLVPAIFLSMSLAVVTGIARGSPVTLLLPGIGQYVAAVLFYFSLVYLIRDRTDLLILFWGLVLGIALVSWTTTLGIGWELESAAYGTRSGGMAGNPGKLVFASVPTLPIAFLLFVRARNLVARGTLVAAAGCIVVGIFAAKSRTSLVCLLAMGGFWMFRMRRFDLLRYTPLVLLLAGAFYFLMPEGFSDRMSTMASAESLEDDSSFRDRLVQFDYATRAFLSNPLTGVGLGQFGIWVNEEHDWGYHRGKGLHNSYFQILTEHGLVGFIPFVLILLTTYRDFSYVQRRGRTFRGPRDSDVYAFAQWALLLQVGFVSIVLSHLTQPGFHFRIAWLFYATAVVLRAQTDAAASRAEPAAEPAPVANGAPPSPFVATPREDYS